MADVADAGIGDAFVAAAERALAAGKPDQVSDVELQRVMTAAVRLFAAKVDAGSEPLALANDQVTPTDVVVAVTGMLRAAGLNLWDLSMWFRRGST